VDREVLVVIGIVVVIDFGTTVEVLSDLRNSVISVRDSV
jgi:hypothetical protein